MKYNDNGTYEDIVIKAVAPGRNSYSSSTSEVYSCNYTNDAISTAKNEAVTEAVSHLPSNVTLLTETGTTKVTISQGTITSGQCFVYVSVNDNEDMLQINGLIEVTCSGTNSPTITIPTSLRPTSNIIFYGSGCKLAQGNNFYSGPVSGTLNTNGNFSITLWNSQSVSNAKYVLYINTGLRFL